MTIKEAIENLVLYNKWRRGANIEMLDPKTIGESIDTLIEYCQHTIGHSQNVECSSEAFIVPKT